MVIKNLHLDVTTIVVKIVPRNKKVVQKNSKPLTKREFLKFLKRQRAKNTIEGILPPIALDEPIPNPVEVAHNNANANHDNVTESQIP